MDDSDSPEALCLYAQTSHFLLSTLTLGLEKKGKYLTPSHLPSSRAPWLVKYRRRQQKGVVGSGERVSPAAQQCCAGSFAGFCFPSERNPPRMDNQRPTCPDTSRAGDGRGKGGDFGSLLLPQAVSHSLVLAHLLRHNQTGFFFSHGLCLLF